MMQHALRPNDIEAELRRPSVIGQGQWKQQQHRGTGSFYDTLGEQQRGRSMNRYGGGFQQHQPFSQTTQRRDQSTQSGRSSFSQRGYSQQRDRSHSRGRYQQQHQVVYQQERGRSFTLGGGAKGGFQPIQHHQQQRYHSPQYRGGDRSQSRGRYQGGYQHQTQRYQQWGRYQGGNGRFQHQQQQHGSYYGGRSQSRGSRFQSPVKGGQRRQQQHHGGFQQDKQRQRSMSQDSRRGGPRGRSASVASSAVSRRQEGGVAGARKYVKRVKKQLRQRYDEKTMTAVDRYIANSELMAELTNTQAYLGRCVKLGVISREYWMSARGGVVVTKHIQRLLDQCAYRLMLDDQKFQTQRKEQVERQLRQDEELLARKLSKNDLQRICAAVKELRSERFSEIRNTQRQAIEELRQDALAYSKQLSKDQQKLKQEAENAAAAAAAKGGKKKQASGQDGQKGAGSKKSGGNRKGGRRHGANRRQRQQSTSSAE